MRQNGQQPASPSRLSVHPTVSTGPFLPGPSASGPAAFCTHLFLLHLQDLSLSPKLSGPQTKARGRSCSQ